MTNHWNAYWQEDANRGYWLKPDKSVIELAEKLAKSSIRDVLDLGCGIGRHALYLAKCGFNVTALDSSPQAQAVLRQQSVEKRVSIKIVSGDYSQDIFPEGSFDFVLSYNVLYHGARNQFTNAIGLIHKWLKPGGWLFFTCPTRRDGKYGNGEQVSLNAFKPLNSVHPGDIHYFADEADISDFLRQFGNIAKDMEEHYWDNQGKKQFSSYWHILARK
jgi:tellurite methyltransferase